MTATPSTPQPTLSRSLLTPGPQPPLSHLGATLLRHVMGTVVRYSLYQLGLPMPESPPVRILRLRVLLDAAPLLVALQGQSPGPEIVASLLDPGGAGELPADAARLRAAASLHRARLAALGPRRGRGGSPGAGPEAIAFATHAEAAALPSRAELWAAISSLVAGRMPYLCDAALGELVTTLGRRRLRWSGKQVEGALGQVALVAHRGRAADLRALGDLDPRAPSWGEAGIDAAEIARRAARARGDADLPARSGRRGGFREAYRFVLTELRPLFAELSTRALADGIVERPDDVFFLPFDLGVELGATRRPSWLAAAVATNRREHEALEREPEHDDEIAGPPVLAPLRDRSADWEIAPLILLR
jgi:hypothetical protein